MTLDAEELAKAELMVHMLLPDQAEERQVLAATELAQAQLAMMRVGGIRNAMLAEQDLASVNLVQLRRLAALDRYEARALTRRRRASQKLQT